MPPVNLLDLPAAAAGAPQSHSGGSGAASTTKSTAVSATQTSSAAWPTTLGALKPPLQSTLATGSFGVQRTEGCLAGTQFCFALGVLSYKNKREYTHLLKSRGGEFGYVLNRHSTCLVTTPQAWALQTMPVITAQKYLVPVVPLKYLLDCCKTNRLLDMRPYLFGGDDAQLAVLEARREQDQIKTLVPQRRTVQFSEPRPIEELVTQSAYAKAFASGMQHHSHAKKPPFLPDQVVAHRYLHEEAPSFPEQRYQIVQIAAFQQHPTSFLCLELHIGERNDNVSAVSFGPPERYQYTPVFRVFSHSGTTSDLAPGKSGGDRSVYHVANLEQAFAVYTHLYNQALSKGMKRVALASTRIGSEKARLGGGTGGLNGGFSGSSLSTGVQRLVDLLYRATAAQLATAFGARMNPRGAIETSMGVLTLEQVEKGEMALRALYLAQQRGLSAGSLTQLEQAFLSAVPWQGGSVRTAAGAAEAQSSLRLMRDALSVNEITCGASSGTALDLQYSSLQCHISELPEESEKYRELAALVVGSQVNRQQSNLEVVTVYEVVRDVEQDTFAHHLGNVRMLFHGTASSNWVGVLSHGLLLPTTVLDLGGTRSDAGQLGAGIYFSPHACQSTRFTTLSPRHTRFLAVCEVALGQCKVMSRADSSLVRPPSGFDSCVGLPTQPSDRTPSEFAHEEFAVYAESQQRLRYLVEYTSGEEQMTPFTLSQPRAARLAAPRLSELAVAEGADADAKPDEKERAELEQAANASVKESSRAGLFAQSGDSVPLEAVHVRGRVLDLISEVVVLQHYRNEGTRPLEAKYVFPLDEFAAVCGFEAFINGKHVVGVVKEKEQAHREYREAIAAGHGAYLLDEEKPDVFTVSVGNLPAGAEVLIKITYVTELQMEGKEVLFLLPAAVTPAVRRQATRTITQTTTSTVGAKAEGGFRFSVQLSIEMPYDIVRLYSPTHQVRVKRTMTKATVQLSESDRPLLEDLMLLIGMTDPHQPRMWVEANSEGHEAAMLSFFPTFDFEHKQRNEYVFMVDRSQSMSDGDTMDTLRRTLRLCLRNLPRNCVFNVISFGSSYERLFEESRPVTHRNLLEALRFTNQRRLRSNFGGTDLWRPLRAQLSINKYSSDVMSTFAHHDPHADRALRNVFVLTDGHITNENYVRDLVMEHAFHTRCFFFAMGSHPNRHLVRRLSLLAGGAVEFVKPDKLPSIEKVRRQMRRALQPGLSKIDVEWRTEHPFEQAPRQVKSIYHGERTIVYGFVPNCQVAQLRGLCGDRELDMIANTHQLAVTQGDLIHRLCARTMIKDWVEDNGANYSDDPVEHELLKKQRKKQIIELGCKYSLVTPFTSFVAIEERTPGEPVPANAPPLSELVQKEEVDLLPYMAWKTENARQQAGALHADAGYVTAADVFGEYIRLRNQPDQWDNLLARLRAQEEAAARAEQERQQAEQAAKEAAAAAAANKFSAPTTQLAQLGLGRAAVDADKGKGKGKRTGATTSLPRPVSGAAAAEDSKKKPKTKRVMDRSSLRQTLAGVAALPEIPPFAGAVKAQALTPTSAVAPARPAPMKPLSFKARRSPAPSADVHTAMAAASQALSATSSVSWRAPEEEEKRAMSKKKDARSFERKPMRSVVRMRAEACEEEADELAWQPEESTEEAVSDWSAAAIDSTWAAAGEPATGWGWAEQGPPAPPPAGAAAAAPAPPPPAEEPEPKLECALSNAFSAFAMADEVMAGDEEEECDDDDDLDAFGMFADAAPKITPSMQPLPMQQQQQQQQQGYAASGRFMDSRADEQERSRSSASGFMDFSSAFKPSAPSSAAGGFLGGVTNSGASSGGFGGRGGGGGGGGGEGSKESEEEDNDDGEGDQIAEEEEEEEGTEEEEDNQEECRITEQAEAEEEEEEEEAPPAQSARAKLVG